MTITKINTNPRFGDSKKCRIKFNVSRPCVVRAVENTRGSTKKIDKTTAETIDVRGLLVVVYLLFNSVEISSDLYIKNILLRSIRCVLRYI